MSEPVVRALTASDGPSARALVHSTYAGTRHLARTLELLAEALSGSDPECAGLVCARDHELHGLLLHGPVAGALAVEKIHALVSADVDSLTLLIDTLRRGSTWRLIICELPGDIEHANASEALAAASFAREGSVAAFFDNDTELGLSVLRRGAGRH